jgi:phage N-6-adenine-methyltransferase
VADLFSDPFRSRPLKAGFQQWSIRLFTARTIISTALTKPEAPIEITGSKQMNKTLRIPSESVHGLIPYSEAVPSLDKLMREGRASSKRIQSNEATIRRTSKSMLIEWLDQAQRLWIAAEIHGLAGRRFTVFAEQIGIDRSRAYELLKLHPYRDAVLTRCGKDDHWPGWERCLSWFRPEPTTEDDTEPTVPSEIEHVETPHEKSDEWGTPQELFDHYHRQYKFTLDVAASAALAKCKRYYSRDDDGLKQQWSGTVWMNPPYANIGGWCKKAYDSAQGGVVVVGLLPAFTDTLWFHNYVSHATIELLMGRPQFVGGDRYAPFASMIAVWRRQSARRGDRLSVTISNHRIGNRRLR